MTRLAGVSSLVYSEAEVAKLEQEMADEIEEASAPTAADAPAEYVIPKDIKPEYLAGGGATGGNVTLGANATLTTGSKNTSTTYAGIISGTGSSLTKTGPGTLVLTGVNTYDAGTKINGGVVQTNASGVGSSGSITFGDNMQGWTVQSAKPGALVLTGPTSGPAGTDTAVVDLSADTAGSFSGGLQSTVIYNANSGYRRYLLYQGCFSRWMF